MLMQLHAAGHLMAEAEAVRLWAGEDDVAIWTRTTEEGDARIWVDLSRSQWADLEIFDDERWEKYEEGKWVSPQDAAGDFVSLIAHLAATLLTAMEAPVLVAYSRRTSGLHPDAVVFPAGQLPIITIRA